MALSGGFTIGRGKDCQFFRKPPSDQIIHIDFRIDRSVDTASAPRHGRAPQVAAILEEINRAGPKAIGIDIVYTDPKSLQPVELPDGTYRKIDEDKEMADAPKGGWAMSSSLFLSKPLLRGRWMRSRPRLTRRIDERFGTDRGTDRTEAAHPRLRAR